MPRAFQSSLLRGSTSCASGRRRMLQRHPGCCRCRQQQTFDRLRRPCPRPRLYVDKLKRCAWYRVINCGTLLCNKTSKGRFCWAPARCCIARIAVPVFSLQRIGSDFPPCCRMDVRSLEEITSKLSGSLQFTVTILY